MTNNGATVTSATAMRDLSDEEFLSLYHSDRFTASVLRSRLNYIVEHMSSAFMREAFSPIIRDWYDFACTISGPPEQDYPMAVVSNSLTVFLGTMADAVRNAVVEHGPENLSPGDVLICNDPYRGGRHVNDVLFIRPVFVEGKIAAFVNLCAHQLDMGGLVPGGFSGTKRNVYEEGLVIPPMLMWSKDQPVRSTFNLFFDNTRFGELLLPDFNSIYQQLKLGERLLIGNVDRYGLDALLGTIRYSVDTSAEQMRRGIEKIPDGDYRGTALVDADGVDDTLEYRVHVLVRKRGGALEVDLSGTSAQARTCINSSVLDSKNAVGVALTMLLDPHAPFTSGTWRHIDLIAPPGTLVSSLPPDGGDQMYWEGSGALIAAIFEALNPVLGDQSVAGDYGSTGNHNAHGVRDDGTPWSSVVQAGGEHGPWGATRDGDGDSYTVLYNLNNLDPAVETMEHDSPMVLLRKEHAIDRGGPGRHRGGAAHLKDTLWLTHAQHWLSPFRTKEATGVAANGGKPGPVGAMWFFPPTDGRAPTELLPFPEADYSGTDAVAGVLNETTKGLDPVAGSYTHFASRPVWQMPANTVLRVLTNGGGGWGDPLDRDTEKVLRDVRDEYISIAGAARDYGVVILGDPATDPEGLRVDEAATASLRERRRS
ncbi:hydantoinase B/oxoprolinase family protein [Qaidamihabitans albus]|uniref:hydantoinase B/oxoprolinase family protein n=1 Tax=Qaidamihabitans albus TaxID=2795733 RepID=UPI0018F26446|nr:hydantoinase B/oxoprolinase family protein [Qaidamihabitans albus]